MEGISRGIGRYPYRTARTPLHRRIVLTFFYGLPRTTGDIDYFTAVPVNLNLTNRRTRFATAQETQGVASSRWRSEFTARLCSSA
jgi:hypothetical protein